MFSGLTDKFRNAFYGWWIVFACATILFLDTGIWWSGFGVLFKPIANDFNWSRAVTSGAFSVYYVGNLFIAPFTGWAIDRFGPRIVSLTGVVLVGLAYICLGFTSSLFTFYAGFAMLAGLGAQGTGLAPHAVAVARWFHKKRGQALGYISAGGSLGGVLLTPLLFPMIDVLGWRVTAITLGIGMLVLGLPVGFLIRSGYAEAYGLSPDGGASGNQPSHQLEAHSDTTPSTPHASTRDILKGRNFWLLVLAWWVSGVNLTAVTVHLVPLLTDRAVPIKWVAVAVQFFSAMSIISRLTLPRLGDRYDIRRVYMVCFLLIGAGHFLLLQTANLALIYLAVGLLGLGLGAVFPLRSTIIAPYFGRERFGIIQGWMISLGATGGMLGPVLMGAVFDTTGSYVAALLLLAATCTLTIVALLALPRAPG